ncbi:MAG: hypothetical protein J7K46_11905 [Bacteroidales bacterium]|nr:hypothetical protein [Bacteroidales bacterium]
MKRMKYFFGKISLFLFILVAGGSFFISSCKKEEPLPPEPSVEEKARDELYKIMQDWYLWYDKMPEVEPKDFTNPQELLDTLIYKPLDKWSFIADKSIFESYFQAGEYLGFGYGYSYDENGYIYITFVFKDSPLYPDGVRRGWKITAIDGHTITPFENIQPLMGDDRAGVTKTLTFQKPDNTTTSFTVTKDTIKINAVLMQDTLHVGNRIVGHLVFQTFVQTANAELDSAFRFFQSVGVNDLIVDLRYNGGGSMDVAVKLASLIAGTSQNGKNFISLKHNDKRRDQDVELNFTNETYALTLNRTIFITSRGSASASEAVINGLRPYMDVSLIGDNTYGKPVGMHSWIYADYVFVPVSFRLVNASGQGDYFEGLTADDFAPDGLHYTFSDRNEPRLHDAIEYIETGVYPNPGQKKSLTIIPEWKGIWAEIGAL